MDRPDRCPAGRCSSRTSSTSRRPRHVRVAHLRRPRAREDGAGRPTSARRRRRARRQGEPPRVRLERHRPEPLVRDGEEPRASGSDDGRLLERKRGLARGGPLRPRPRERHGLLDPASLCLRRHRRPEDQVGNHLNGRRLPARADPRRDRPHGPHGRGRRAHVVGPDRPADAGPAPRGADRRADDAPTLRRRRETPGQEPRRRGVRRRARGARRARRPGRDPGARREHLARPLSRSPPVAPRDVPSARRRVFRQRPHEARACAEGRLGEVAEAYGALEA